MGRQQLTAVWSLLLPAGSEGSSFISDTASRFEERVLDTTPHRPVLAALPHTVLTLDMPPHGGWRKIARPDTHEQRVEPVAIERRLAPAFPSWAAVGCAVPAHETSSGRPVAGSVTAPSGCREPRGIGSSR